jgi:hypothetical protein
MSQLLIKSTTAAWYMTQNANQVLYSGTFDNAVWSTANTTLTASQTDPSAGTTAYRLTATANDAVLQQPINLTGDFNRTFSIYIKRITGAGAVSITVDGATHETVTITGAWTRYDTTLVTSGTVTPGIKLAVSGDAVDIAWAQFEDGLTPTDYLANTANRFTVTQIVDADYPANTVRGCAFLDGRFFVMTPEGDIQQSALENAASWAALDFIKSQNDPSKGVYLSKVNNYIVAFKDWSIEFFYDAANPVGSILSPVQNASIQIGCASDGSVQDIAGSIAFMGQTRAGFGRKIYILNGTSPQPVSTPQVEKIINTSDLSTVYSWQAAVGTHLLYGITLTDVNATLVYDMSAGLWSFFTYLTINGGQVYIDEIAESGVVTAYSHGLGDGDIIKVSSTNADFNGWHVATDVTADTFQIQATGAAFAGSGAAYRYVESYFPIVASVRANGRQYMQDATSGALYELGANEYKDAIGAIAARIRTPKLDDETTNNKTMAKVELVGDKIESTALIRWSDDDYVTYSKFRPVDLNLPRSQIRRIGDYRRRAFEILHLKDALLRISALELE